MVKLSDRSFFIGLCVIGLLVAVLSLLWGHGRHRAEEQSWSMRQRALVSTGSVREEASSAPVAPVMPERDERPTPPLANQRESKADDEIATDFQSATSQDRIEPAPAPRRSHAKSAAKPRAAHAAGAGRDAPPQARNAQSTESEKPAVSEADERHADVEVKRAEPRDLEPPQTSRADADMSREPSPPPVSPSPAQSEVRASGNTQLQVDAATPRPKTRKDVEDEVSKARMNGSLPRFGNPDPYGPGGAPSQTN
jgi:hypothetical protein